MERKMERGWKARGEDGVRWQGGCREWMQRMPARHTERKDERRDRVEFMSNVWGRGWVARAAEDARGSSTAAPAII